MLTDWCGNGNHPLRLPHLYVLDAFASCIIPPGCGPALLIPTIVLRLISRQMLYNFPRRRPGFQLFLVVFVVNVPLVFSGAVFFSVFLHLCWHFLFSEFWLRPFAAEFPFYCMEFFFCFRSLLRKLNSLFSCSFRRLLVKKFLVGWSLSTIGWIVLFPIGCQVLLSW